MAERRMEGKRVLVTGSGTGVGRGVALEFAKAGAAVVLWKARRSRAARVLLAWVLVYPMGDVLFARPLPTGPDRVASHAMRSYPGMSSLYLLAAVGLGAVGIWTWQRRRRLTMAVGGVLLAGILVWNAVYYPSFFRDFGRNREVYHAYHTDLVKAAEWLKPRLDQYDAVFCSCVFMNQPYLPMLVVLDVDPKDWFRQERDYREVTYARDGLVRWGKIRWMYWDLHHQDIRNLQSNGRRDRVLFIIRPGELPLRYPIHAVQGPDGTVPLLFYERDL